MEIILLEKVAKLGNLGDVVKVAPGYARNYLVPRRKAKMATSQNLKEFAEKRAELEKREVESLASARALASVIEGLTVQVVRKAGMDGRLFGSVNSSDISEELAKLGHTVHRRDIVINAIGGIIKTVSEYAAVIKLHNEVHVEVKVSVLGTHA